MLAGAIADTSPHWAEVVDRIRVGDQAGVEALYSAVSGCARVRLFQAIDPQSVDDHLQEIMMIVLEAIRSGELRDPECLMGFIRTVTRRRIASHIRGAIIRRRRLIPVASAAEPVAPPHESPEARAVRRQRVEDMRKALRRLRNRDREILVRFYYREQSPEQICREMRITSTQFRLFKSRAIARCAELANSRSRARA